MGQYFDALAGSSMPAGALQTAAMQTPGGGISSPRGNPTALPPPQADPMPAGGPAMDAGVQDPNAAAAPAPVAAPAGQPAPAPGEQGAPPAGAPPQAPVPQFELITQSDGTLLMHIKNGDGSLGPVIDVLKAPKLPGSNVEQKK